MSAGPTFGRTAYMGAMVWYGYYNYISIFYYCIITLFYYVMIIFLLLYYMIIDGKKCIAAKASF